VQELAAVLASMIEIRDSTHHENEQLSAKYERASPFFIMLCARSFHYSFLRCLTCHIRVDALQDALALATKAGFRNQLGFKQ
jgi:hypothetical protein